MDIWLIEEDNLFGDLLLVSGVKNNCRNIFILIIKNINQGVKSAIGIDLEELNNQ